MTEETLFELARKTPEAERTALLDRACEGMPELRARVEALLQADAGSSPFSNPSPTIEATAGFQGTASYNSSDPVPGIVIAGRYTLEQKLGEGGMGEVWVAKQSEPVKRKVAVKLIKAGMDSKSVVQRFEQERQALAMMDHPNIAKVLDGGLTADRRPYFVMELVNGLPLTLFCDEMKLPPRERLQLFIPICQAVQHAHQKGIVHRDLKPSNILITIIDGKPSPKVIDFGVAKATSGRLTDQSFATQFGGVVGTLEYMSPEQAGFSGEDIDTRADIYSLGVILYELLTGLRPIDASRLKHAAFAEMIRIIQEEEPSKPSTRLSSDASLASLAALRQTEPRKLMALLRGELDWIVMKCLEKGRDRRYETANGLARDIQRYLADETVEARPPSTSYRLSKFFSRNRGVVAACASVAAALFIGLLAFAWQARIAGDQRDLAQAAEKAENEQRLIADMQRDRALAAEAETRKRAEELQKVSDFQAKMLAQIDPTEAGKMLTKDVTNKFEAALTKAGIPVEERAKQVEAFSRQWKQVNATDAARELIDRTILKPAVVAIDKQFKDQPVIDSRLRQVLSDLYDDLGMIDEAIPLMATSLVIRRRVLGDDHKDTLTSINNMGYLLQVKGKLAEAEPYLREVLDRKRRVLGEEHEDTIVAICNMGSQFYFQGKFKDAEPYYRESLEKSRRILGDKNDITLRVIGCMATVLKAQGKLSEAEPYARETVEKSRLHLGEEHPNTLDVIGDLGTLLQAQEKLQEAEPFCREALEKSRKVRGEDHRRTLTALSELAILLQSQGKLNEAEPYCREALLKQRRLFGDEQLETLISYNSLGGLLLAQNKHAEAASLLAPVETAARKTLTNAHATRLAQFLMLLGKARTGIGQFTSAEANLIEAHPLFVKTLSNNRKATRACSEALVDLYTKWNIAEPGKSYDAKAAEWRGKLTPVLTEPGKPDTKGGK